MEFNEKLQELRKQKGLTQEELAEVLFVSRTAISKWESGRGYPNIDSLKAISKYFSVTVDELLSGEELLGIAEEDTKQKQKRFCDLVFGLLDCSMAMLLFLPFFAQRTAESVHAVSLMLLDSVNPYLKTAYFILVGITVLFGITILAMQSFNGVSWQKLKYKLSLFFGIFGILLFILSSHPYAAVYTFVLLIIKAWILVKR